MKRIYQKITCIAGIFLFLSVLASSGQDGTRQTPSLLSPDSLLRAAKVIIESSACRVLITVGEDGKPYAREMAPFPLEKDWTIWFGTSTISRKVKQILDNPNVVAYFYDPVGMSYVSVQGKASLVNDADLKTKYWVDAYKVYYPDRDKDYILIKLVPDNLEVVSYKYRIFWNSNSDPQAFSFSLPVAK